jgi:hypothetical protein
MAYLTCLGLYERLEEHYKQNCPTSGGVGLNSKSTRTKHGALISSYTLEQKLTIFWGHLFDVLAHDMQKKGLPRLIPWC